MARLLPGWNTLRQTLSLRAAVGEREFCAPGVVGRVPGLAGIDRDLEYLLLLPLPSPPISDHQHRYTHIQTQVGARFCLKEMKKGGSWWLTYLWRSRDSRSLSWGVWGHARAEARRQHRPKDDQAAPFSWLWFFFPSELSYPSRRINREVFNLLPKYLIPV